MITLQNRFPKDLYWNKIPSRTSIVVEKSIYLFSRFQRTDWLLKSLDWFCMWEKNQKVELWGLDLRNGKKIWKINLINNSRFSGEFINVDNSREFFMTLSWILKTFQRGNTQLEHKLTISENTILLIRCKHLQWRSTLSIFTHLVWCFRIHKTG